jgi:response regulator RpfG family c-di-GMP phosphodiesterase
MVEGTKILIVDDDEDVVQVLSDFLELSGCEVHKAYDGQEALRILNKEKIDIVITDIKLPGTNGISLLERIKLIDHTIPVIMMTGYFEPGLVVDAIKKGASDFLMKPIEFDKLLLTIMRTKREKEILVEMAKIQGSLEDKKKIMVLNRELQRKIKEMTNMYRISAKFNRLKLQENIFEKILDVVCEVFEGRSSAYYIIDGEKKEIVPITVRGEERFKKRIDLPEGLFDELSSQKRHLRIGGTIFVPVVIRNQCVGLIGLEEKKNGMGTQEEELFLLKLIAENSSSQIENRMLYESLFNGVLQTLKSLITSIHMRDAYTEGHCTRVAKYAVKLAEFMNVPEYDRHALEIVAPVHDVGKIGIPDSILLKPERLSDKEYEIIKNHTIYGEKIISTFEILSNEAIIVRHHHERYDGKGYPDHLGSKDIPLCSRIIAVCDAYDAMVTERPYKKALSKEEALSEIRRCRGTQFDPDVAHGFLEMMQDEGK